jgi:hypothetical protein
MLMAKPAPSWSLLAGSRHPPTVLIGGLLVSNGQTCTLCRVLVRPPRARCGSCLVTWKRALRMSKHDLRA